MHSLTIWGILQKQYKNDHHNQYTLQKTYILAHNTSDSTKRILCAAHSTSHKIKSVSKDAVTWTSNTTSNHSNEAYCTPHGQTATEHSIWKASPLTAIPFFIFVYIMIYNLPYCMLSASIKTTPQRFHFHPLIRLLSRDSLHSQLSLQPLIFLCHSL